MSLEMQQRQIQLMELEMVQKMYAAMSDSCFKKCIPLRFTDGDLTRGEAVCLDRCSAKYVETFSHTSQAIAALMSSGVPPK